jgi:hypothetical protein
MSINNEVEKVATIGMEFGGGILKSMSAVSFPVNGS